jgi:hypothetical protein
MKAMGGKGLRMILINHDRVSFTIEQHSSNHPPLLPLPIASKHLSSFQSQVGSGMAQESALTQQANY